MIPDGLRYSKEHEWVKTSGAEATVGITHHAQNELGDIVFVDVPAVGSSVTAGAVFGSVESVKAVSDIYSPVSGEITAVNDALRDTPETVNADPYGSGWIVRVRLRDPNEIAGLMDAAGYKAYLEGGSA